MKRVQSIVGRSPAADTANPDWVALADPYAGDEAIVWPGSYADYQRHAERTGVPPRLSAEEYAVLDLEFERVYRAVLDGEMPDSALDPLADELLVGRTLVNDQRPPGVALARIDDDRLADIAENQLPGVGLVGPDRILGPWADEPLPRWLRVQVGAVMAFVPEVDPGVPPWARAIKRRPRPDTEIRQSLRVMARSAPCLWAVNGQELEPLLPLGAKFIHPGPVRDVPDVEAVIGRVVNAVDGPRLVASIPMIRRPPAEPILRRLRLEWLRLRRRERRLSLEDVLRERSEVLYRSCLEWLWLHCVESGTRPW